MIYPETPYGSDTVVSRYIAALEERCAHLESALRTSDPSNEDVRDHLGVSQPEDDHHSTIQDDHHSTIQDVEDTLDWDQGLADDPWPGAISQIDGLPPLGENVSPFGSTGQLQHLQPLGDNVPSFGDTERLQHPQPRANDIPPFRSADQPQHTSPLHPSFSEIPGPSTTAHMDQMAQTRLTKPSEMDSLQSDPVTAAQHVHGLCMKAFSEDPTATRKSGLSFARLAKAWVQSMIKLMGSAAYYCQERLLPLLGLGSTQVSSHREEKCQRGTSRSGRRNTWQSSLSGLRTYMFNHVIPSCK